MFVILYAGTPIFKMIGVGGAEAQLWPSLSWTHCFPYPATIPKGNARYMYDGIGSSDRSESNRGHDGEIAGLLIVTDFMHRLASTALDYPPDLIGLAARSPRAPRPSQTLR